MYLHFGADGHMEGFSEADLINDAIFEAGNHMGNHMGDIRVLGTNPNRFLMQFDGNNGHASSPMLPPPTMASVFLSAKIPAVFRHQSLPARTSTPSIFYPLSEDGSLGYPEPCEMEGTDRTSSEPVRDSMNYANSSANTAFASSRDVSPAKADSHSGQLISNPEVQVVPGPVFRCSTHAAPGVDLCVAASTADPRCRACIYHPYPSAVSIKRALDSEGTSVDPHILDTPESSPEPEQSEAKRRRLASPAPSEPSLLTPEPSLQPEPAELPRWLVQTMDYPYPIRERRAYPAAQQCGIAVLELGAMYSRNFVFEERAFSTEPRLLRRDTFLKLPSYRDQTLLTEVEVYYNHDRRALFSLEQLELLRLQSHEERRGGEYFYPPGFTLISNHLNVSILPQQFADLHLNPDCQTPVQWEPVHRILYEIISLYRDRPTISHILHGRLQTPLLFQCIPFSPKYRFGHGDPLTIFFSAIPGQLKEMLERLLGLHQRPFPIAAAIYEQAVHERETYAKALEVPSTFLTIPAPTTPRFYPGDYLTPGTIPEHHPFLFTYERNFLVHCADYFSKAFGPVKHLSPLVERIVAVRFIHQRHASELFLSGVLHNAGQYELYNSEYVGDDLDQTDRFDELELDRSPGPDNDHPDQPELDYNDNEYDPAEYVNGWE
ncbi:hypothetical protein B0H13DRAFT_1853134 [Mycena leptocephala]|nr:hypothetical protein B0H13DRAFT_1853134 [Mycena leptocephala]